MHDLTKHDTPTPVHSISTLFTHALVKELLEIARQTFSEYFIQKKRRRPGNLVEIKKQIESRKKF